MPACISPSNKIDKINQKAFIYNAIYFLQRSSGWGNNSNYRCLHIIIQQLKVLFIPLNSSAKDCICHTKRKENPWVPIINNKLIQNEIFFVTGIFFISSMIGQRLGFWKSCLYTAMGTLMYWLYGGITRQCKLHAAITFMKEIVSVNLY